MVGVTKRKRGDNYYYYLYHDIRKGGKRKQRDRYLGPELPDNLDEEKDDFEREVYLEDWEPALTKIHQSYNNEIEKLTEEELQKKNKRFSMRYNYDTQKIEGSKLTYRETVDLLESGISPKGKPMYDIKETEAHDKIFDEMIQHEGDLSEGLVVAWHHELLKDTEPEKAGKIRTTNVDIRGSEFTSPPGYLVRKMLGGFFVWYKENKNKIHPVILAALVHQRFVTIHPFRDGNGRLSRLMMNFVLKKNGYPLINLDSGKRNPYFNSLEKSQVNKKENRFVRWLVETYLRKNA